MPIDWKVTSLGEIVDVRHGYAFKGKHFTTEPGPIVMTPGNFHDEGGFKFKSPEKHYSGPVPEGFILAAGDLLVAMTEQKRGLLGSAALIPGTGTFLHNQRLGLVVERAPDQVSRRFLYYLFNTPYVRNQIQATANGAKVRHTSPSRIKDVEVRVPPLTQQKRIAAVLAAYDELIENNLRRIEILEEMAQAVYREWFVNFRFPGHEQIGLVDSPLGPIPDRWWVEKVDTAIELNPRVRLERDAEYTFVPMGSLAEGSMVIDPLETRLGPSGAQFRNGDTLLARITPSLENGKTAYVQCLQVGETACGSTEFIVMRSCTLTPEYVYCLARTDAFRGVAIKSMVGASGRQRVQEAAVSGFLFAHAPSDVLGRFGDAVRPMFALVQSLVNQNANLRATRNLLLPKLVSGMIDVSDLDIDTDWLVA